MISLGKKSSEIIKFQDQLIGRTFLSDYHVRKLQLHTSCGNQIPEEKKIRGMKMYIFKNKLIFTIKKEQRILIKHINDPNNELPKRSPLTH